MTRSPSAIVLCLLFPFMIFAVGCGGSTDPEEMVKEQVTEMGNLATAVEEGKPQAEIDSIKSRMRGIATRMAIHVSKDKQQEMARRYEEEYRKIIRKMKSNSDVFAAEMEKLKRELERKAGG